MLIFLRRDCPVSSRYAPVIQQISAQHERDASFWLVFPDKAETPQTVHEYLRNITTGCRPCAIRSTRWSNSPRCRSRRRSRYSTATGDLSTTEESIIGISIPAARVPRPPLTNWTTPSKPASPARRRRELKSGEWDVTYRTCNELAAARMLAGRLRSSPQRAPPESVREAALARRNPPPTPDSHVTFNRDIAPIIFRSCSTCHHAGEAGPFSLLTYSDVKKHAPPDCGCYFGANHAAVAARTAGDKIRGRTSPARLTNRSHPAMGGARRSSKANSPICRRSRSLPQDGGSASPT